MARGKPEHRIHTAGVRELRSSFVRRGWWSGDPKDPHPFFHCPNERMAPKHVLADLNDLGVSAGQVDLVIVWPTAGGEFPGAAIEIKAPRGTVDPKQRAWLAFWKAAGFWSGVVRGHVEFAQRLAGLGYLSTNEADSWIAWAERIDPEAL